MNHKVELSDDEWTGIIITLGQAARSFAADSPEKRAIARTVERIRGQVEYSRVVKQDEINREPRGGLRFPRGN